MERFLNRVRSSYAYLSSLDIQTQYHIPEFRDLWHGLKVPPEADLLKDLASEGLQATAGEALIPKGPLNRKKGKKSAPRKKQTRITNVHVKGEIDLSKDYVAPSASGPK